MQKDILTKLYEKHNKWLIIVKRLGATNDVAEDLVQDMYIKMHGVNKNTIIKSLEVYAYYTLRNLYFDYYKQLKKKRANEVSVEDLIIDCDTFEIEDKDNFCMKLELEESERIDRLIEAKGILLWYDRKLLTLHYEGNTMRSLARDTKISLSSIFNTIKNARNTIKEYLEDEK